MISLIGDFLHFGMFCRTLFCLMSCLSFQQLCGQEYKFLNLTTEDGLISNRVLELFQHENGDIWIGTQEGISIYDGLEFNQLTQADGLPSNVIYSITSMPGNRMAIGTIKGLSIIEGKKITNYDTISGLPANAVRKVKFIEDRLWISTDKGLITLMNDSLIPPPFGPLQTSAVVVDITADKRGRIWFSTGGTLSLGDGVFIWTGTEMLHLTRKTHLASGRVTRTFFHKDEVWVCALAGVTIYDLDFKVDTILRSMGVPKDFYAHCLDADGNLWSAGFDNSIYKPVQVGFESVCSDENLFGSVYTMIGDDEGNVWCGSRDKGVTKISLKPFINYGMNQGLSSSGINRFAPKNDSMIYVATDSGLDLFNKKTMSIDGVLIPDRKVRCIYPEGQDSIWAGLNDEEGIAFSSNGKNQFFRSQSQEVIFISDILRKGDTLFLATHKGLGYFNGSTIEYFSFPGLPKNRSHTNQILGDADGSLWVATLELGLFNYNKGKLKSYGASEGLDVTSIRNLYLDSNQRLWCVTDNGLYRKIGDKFLQIKADATSSSAGGFLSIIQDNDSTFWVGMSRGVSRLVFKGDSLSSVRTYGVADGFENMDCNPRAIHKDQHGRIWFGTNGGINVYYPEFDRINKLAPKLRFTDVLLFQTATDWAELSETTFDGLPINAELPYDKNHISFRFKGVTHVSPEEVVYKFRLVGQTNDWIETKERKADYNNLPPGEYRFEVMCSNKDGFSTPQPLVMEFTISPPFWQTWWFYMIIVLIISAGIFSYVQIRAANFKITQINQELNVQKEIISSKNKDIMDSIYYAKRIQDAVLPPPDVPGFFGTFVFFKPKDVVSGDFYWFYQLDGLSLFAAADCTGHGVPGAFMSIIGYNLLDKIVGEYNIVEPAKILDKLNDEISRTLHQKSNEKDQIRDGMDMALVCYNKHNRTLEFAGAVNPLWLMRNGKVDIVKGDRMPIGTRDIYNKKYTNHQIAILPGDQIYLHTDGIIDQFGADGGGKFKSRRLKELLEATQHLSPDAQKSAISHAFEKWRGTEEQLDDLLVIGSRFD